MRTILLNCYQITGYVLAGLLLILGESGELTADTKLLIDTKQEKFVVLALGDSLTAGFGVDKEYSFPSRIQVKIDDENLGYKIVNAGISGDTTAGGVRRINWLMKHKPQVVILALGANDGLRGLSVDEMRANLESMIHISHENNARVLLAGMKALPNYGKDYVEKFESVYPELAKSMSWSIYHFYWKASQVLENILVPMVYILLHQVIKSSPIWSGNICSQC